MLIIHDEQLARQLKQITEHENRPVEDVLKSMLSQYPLKRETGVQGAGEFLEEFNQSQPDLQDITLDDLKRVQEIRQQYASARLAFVDCCLMALSERLKITQVCTLDHRDFGIFRPKHCDYLELLS